MKKIMGIVCAAALTTGMVGLSANATAQSSFGLSSSGLFGNTQPNVHAQPEQDSDAQAAEGKGIFQAVHFMVGEKAGDLSLVKDIEKNPDFDAAANEKFAYEVIGALEADNPQYFSRYATEMTSGNPVRVEKAIESTQADISNYLETTYPDMVAKGDMTPQACSIGVGGCVWTVALAWNYGAVVNVGAAVTVYTALWGPNKTWSPFAEETAELQRQETIAALSKELQR